MALRHRADDFHGLDPRLGADRERVLELTVGVGHALDQLLALHGDGHGLALEQARHGHGLGEVGLELVLLELDVELLGREHQHLDGAHPVLVAAHDLEGVLALLGVLRDPDQDAGVAPLVREPLAEQLVVQEDLEPLLGVEPVGLDPDLGVHRQELVGHRDREVLRRALGDDLDLRPVRAVDVGRLELEDVEAEVLDPDLLAALLRQLALPVARGLDRVRTGHDPAQLDLLAHVGRLVGDRQLHLGLRARLDLVHDDAGGHVVGAVAEVGRAQGVVAQPERRDVEAGDPAAERRRAEQGGAVAELDGPGRGRTAGDDRLQRGVLGQLRRVRVGGERRRGRREDRRGARAVEGDAERAGLAAGPGGLDERVRRRRPSSATVSSTSTKARQLVSGVAGLNPAPRVDADARVVGRAGVRHEVGARSTSTLKRTTL